MTQTIRKASPPDTESCGAILHEAFREFEKRQDYPHFYTSRAYATQIANILVKDARVQGLVAEVGGSVAGCCFLHNYSSTAGLGPVAVDPKHQNHGIGRALVSAALEQSACYDSVRLTQDAANVASLALYASLGFEVKEPLILVQGLTRNPVPSKGEVRALEPSDVDEAAALCERIYGFGGRGALDSGLVTLRDGRITGYSPGVSIHGYAVAEAQEDLQTLLLETGRSGRKPVSFLLPLRFGSLARWCLREGLRLIRPMMLMSTGKYHRPEGCFLPSLLC